MIITRMRVQGHAFLALRVWSALLQSQKVRTESSKRVEWTTGTRAWVRAMVPCNNERRHQAQHCQTCRASQHAKELLEMLGTVTINEQAEAVLGCQPGHWQRIRQPPALLEGDGKLRRCLLSPVMNHLQPILEAQTTSSDRTAASLTTEGSSNTPRGPRLSIASWMNAISSVACMCRLIPRGPAGRDALTVDNGRRHTRGHGLGHANKSQGSERKRLVRQRRAD